jgi:hypothetical protein
MTLSYFFFWDRFSLCRPDWLQTLWFFSSDSRVVGLQGCLAYISFFLIPCSNDSSIVMFKKKKLSAVKILQEGISNRKVNFIPDTRWGPLHITSHQSCKVESSIPTSQVKKLRPQEGKDCQSPANWLGQDSHCSLIQLRAYLFPLCSVRKPFPQFIVNYVNEFILHPSFYGEDELYIGR